MKKLRNYQNKDPISVPKKVFFTLVKWAKIGSAGERKEFGRQVKGYNQTFMR